MSTIKTTEMPSAYRHLESMSTREILTSINSEDASVPAAVRKAIARIEKLVDTTADKLMAGGRLFYTGAGTSGRLGVLDASECPPTYGVPGSLVTGIIAGGDAALRHGIEEAEDSEEQGWEDLKAQGIARKDVVVGIAASGTTPYVLGALKGARKHGICTACIVCNKNSPIATYADYPIEVIVGPEFVTGSTRMKSGTAQKLVLNMISTSVMIRTGRVYDNRMVNMQISNNKLIDRGTRMIMEKAGMEDYEAARSLLLYHGSVKLALESLESK